jgi:hypothetical protein
VLEVVPSAPLPYEEEEESSDPELDEDEEISADRIKQLKVSRPIFNLIVE